MKELTLQAQIENIPRVTAFIDEQLEALDCPMKPQMQMDVAIDSIIAWIWRIAMGDHCVFISHAFMGSFIESVYFIRPVGRRESYA